jgi:ubiquinol-cytochrome c reductase iron-sulfur subunit
VTDRDRRDQPGRPVPDQAASTAAGSAGADRPDAPPPAGSEEPPAPAVAGAADDDSVDHEPNEAPRATVGEAVLTPRGVRAERGAAFAFLVAMVSAIALAVVYWQGGQPQAEGVLLALALGGIGVGIVTWAKHFMPAVEVEEERHPLPSTEEEIAAFTTDFQAGEASLTNRRVLVATAGGACAALGVALLFPIRSLGPRPGRGLKVTPFRGGGMRVVREDGSPIRPREIDVDGLLTVWPEGHTDAADGQTLLIRLRQDQEFEPREGREDWTVDDVVAYSKICTHVGCPVGLYQSESALLLCPCHQSTFDVLRGAKPVFGPAARSLPQLPLDVDDEGYLIARGDFSDPVGPGFWDRGRGG